MPRGIYERTKPNWNKGLTKETDPRVAASAKAISETNEGQVPWNKGLTKETDLRLAASAKAIGKANRGKSSWNKGLTKETSLSVAAQGVYDRPKSVWKPWNSGLTAKTDAQIIPEVSSRWLKLLKLILKWLESLRRLFCRTEII